MPLILWLLSTTLNLCVMCVSKWVFIMHFWPYSCMFAPCFVYVITWHVHNSGLSKNPILPIYQFNMCDSQQILTGGDNSWPHPIVKSIIGVKSAHNRAIDFKVNMLNSINVIIQTPIFQYYVIRCGSKNDNKNTCLWMRLDYVLKLVTHCRLKSQHKMRSGGGEAMSMTDF